MKVLYFNLLILFLPLQHAWGQAPPLAEEPLLLGADSARYWRESHSGGPGKDGIPSIDRPRFLSAAEGDKTLEDGDIVMGVHHNGVARAYPQRILVWHEIVNDTIGGKNIAVTYCPLTGTGIGFARGRPSLASLVGWSTAIC